MSGASFSIQGRRGQGEIKLDFNGAVTISIKEPVHMRPKLSVFGEGLVHPKGVAVHPDGSVRCGGVRAGRFIALILPEPKSKKSHEPVALCWGIALLPDLKWLAVCNLKRRVLCRLELPETKLHVLDEVLEGWRLNIPNYSVFDRS